MNKEVTGSGLGIADVLLVVFVVLKLAGVIDWPWVWVLSPIWISALLIFVVAFIAVLIKHLISDWRN